MSTEATWKAKLEQFRDAAIEGDEETARAIRDEAIATSRTLDPWDHEHADLLTTLTWIIDIPRWRSYCRKHGWEN